MGMALVVTLAQLNNHGGSCVGVAVVVVVVGIILYASLVISGKE